MNKLKYWILGILTTLAFTALTAYAASWFLPPVIHKGDLIVGGSDTQAIRLSTGTVGSVLFIDPTTKVPKYTATSTLGLAGTIPTINNATGPAFTIATTTDTNLLISVLTGGSTATITPAWTGTLAAGRLNSNVVQGVTNDTNVTGSIAAQNLTLGWTGTLADSRITSASNWNGKISSVSLTGGATISGAAFTFASSSPSTDWNITCATVTCTFNHPNNLLTGNQTITLSGDVTGSGATAITTTYNNVVPVNKGGTATSTAPSQTGQVLVADGTGAKYGPAIWVNGNGITITTSTLAQITIACATASGSVNGCLSSGDWTTFNSKVSTSRTISAGTGLTGGGDLSADRTISLSVPVTAANGGTGTTTVPTTQGQILAVDGSGAKYAPTTLIAGANITIATTTAGQITFSATGSTGLTSWAGLTGPTIAVATTSDTNINIQLITGGTSNATITPVWVGTLADGRIASAATWNAKQNALTNPDTGTGTNGQVAYFTGATSLSSASAFLFDGTVVGVNATSSGVALNVKGISGSNAALVVASSSGTTLFQVTPAGIASTTNVNISALGTCSNGLITNANGVVACNGSAFLTGNQTITLSGDVSGSGATAITTTYNNVVPANKGGTATSTAPSQTGQVLLADGTGTKYGPAIWVNGANITISTSTAGQVTIAATGLQASGNYITALTGDVSASGPGSVNSTLATVNSNTTVCGDATHVCQMTANGKGLTTSNSAVSITGLLTGGTIGKVPYWTSSTALGNSIILSDASNAGVNATSSTVTFLVQGTGGTNDIFDIATSTGTKILTMAYSGTTTFGSTFTVASGSTSSFLTINPTPTLATNTTTNILNVSPTINSLASMTPATALYMQNTVPTVRLSAPTTTITSLYNSYRSMTFATGTITSYYGLYVDGPSVTASSTLSNAYGLIIAPSSSSTVYTMLNGIGSTTPTATLALQGGSAQTQDILRVATSTGASFLSVTSAGQVLISTTGRLTIPQGTNPTLSAAGDIAHDTTQDQLLYGSQPNVLMATSSKTMTIIGPTASEDDDFMITDVPIHVTKVQCSVRNSNTSSVTFSLWHGANRSSASEYLVSGQACNATTTPASVTLTTADLEAGDVLVATTSAATLASTTSFTIWYTYDRQ